MKKRVGTHFYINILNFTDVSENEEKMTGEVRHSIHALDTFFSAIEEYGLKHYPDLFVIEKITGARLHMYVICDDISESFEVVSAVTKYAYELSVYLGSNISKYKTLIPFEINAGACFGHFYEFEFKGDRHDEMTSIGYAANYAAKLQSISTSSHILVSENIYESLSNEQKTCFRVLQPRAIRKYKQDKCYNANISFLPTGNKYEQDLKRAMEIADRVDLKEMRFREATQPVDYTNLSKTECKKIYGIPLFADVRGFTSKFDEEDVNLDEMAVKTQNILMSMYKAVDSKHGIHVQFQGDRELAIFHDYGDYHCVTDAVIAALKIIDVVKGFNVAVGVGQASGKLFAAKIGARGEKDNILLGRTVIVADKNEDEYAKENQLVITNDIFTKLQNENAQLASLFKILDEDTFYTDCSYSGFIVRESQKQLQKDNSKNNYNGAWGIEQIERPN